MCGVAGILDLEGRAVEVRHVKAMGAALAHRGPDGEGHLVDGEFGVAHRRLAVLDVSNAGRQPMATPDGRWVISYNGEVYNFRELRRELEKEGWTFRSGTDTEVVLAALASWGQRSVLRLNGMFAFAVWDAQERTVLLARDRFGIKPMYYAFVGGTLLFGSEVKALRTYPEFRTALDRSGLTEYLTFQNFVSDRTLFQGVRTLPAAHLLTVTAGTREGIREGMREGDVEPVRYWGLASGTSDGDGTSDGGGTNDYVEEFDRLFRQAVTRQLVSDVPVGSYLSGGVDSGSITAVAAGQIPDLDTFTVGFETSADTGFDEREAARATAVRCGTRHHECEIGPGIVAATLADVVWHVEVPRVGQSYPNLCAARLARDFSTVVLAGTGGDELFGGYPWRYEAAAAGGGGVGDVVERSYAYWQRLLPEGDRRRLMAPLGEAEAAIDTFGLFRRVVGVGDGGEASFATVLRLCSTFDFTVFLQGLLAVEDALSMAVGLETRVPFLDNDLVDFAWSLPATAKVTRDPVEGKVLLRRALRKYVGPEIAHRPKQGFSAPDAGWFRTDAAGYVRARLWDDARIFEYLDAREVRHHLGEHFDGRRNARLLIWSLLCLEQWCETFLD